MDKGFSTEDTIVFLTTFEVLLSQLNQVESFAVKMTPNIGCTGYTETISFEKLITVQTKLTPHCSLATNFGNYNETIILGPYVVTESSTSVQVSFLDVI